MSLSVLCGDHWGLVTFVVVTKDRVSSLLIYEMNQGY